MNRLCREDIRLFTSKSGQPSAVHLSSGQLIHSRVDPLAEAEAIAAEVSSQANDILLLGGGLGYLAEALLRFCEGAVYVLEPEPLLQELAREARPASQYLKSPRIIQIDCFQLGELSQNIPVIVSPYLPPLSRATQSPLTGIVHEITTRQAAERNQRNSRAVGESISNAEFRALPEPAISREREISVVGAGPSLDSVLSTLTRRGADHRIIAVSGAVPALSAAGIIPDWIVCMERSPIILTDLKQAEPRSRLILLPTCNRELALRFARRSFRAEINGAPLRTGGGTTLLPALNFALKHQPESVFLLGADLENRGHGYAVNSNRKLHARLLDRMPPRFIAMRAAIEAMLVDCTSPARLFHVLDHDGCYLDGLIPMTPDEYKRQIADTSTKTRDSAQPEYI